MTRDPAPPAAGASTATPATADYDVLVVGGGMVGAALACALEGSGLRIGLIEASRPEAPDHPGYDERTLALAWGTRRIFEGLGLWPALAVDAHPITRIHISDRGHATVARLDAYDEGVAALGYVATARTLGSVLNARLAVLPDVELLCPATFEALTVGPQYAECAVCLDGASCTLRARLVVAADGARSRVREQTGIPVLSWDYGQTAITANLTPERGHGDVAFERFTSDGPLALLPLAGGRCALVLTVASDEAERVLRLADAEFLALVQARFGHRLGRLLHVGRRHAHPLRLLKARAHTAARVAVVGNAAHTLHPIAGQGFNLGLRDVAALAEVLADAARRGCDPGSPEVLAAYADWRRWDQRNTIAFTDVLARLFGNPLAPVRLVRNLGLLAFELCPPAKHRLARQLMGLSGRLPRLALGLPLTTGAA